jgi:hypothetical protein
MNIKMHLVRTKNTSVICVVCGRFQADHAAVLADGSEAEYGAHKKCAPMLHVKRTRKVSHAAE